MKKVTFILIAVVLFIMTGCSITNREEQKTEDPASPSREVMSDSENIFCVKEYTLQLPDQWLGNYAVDIYEEEGVTSWVAFYAAGCHKETEAGWLFSIGRYEDMDYMDLPAYQFLAEQEGVSYIAVYPTDVQTEDASETAKEQYYELLQGVEEVIDSFRFIEP